MVAFDPAGAANNKSFRLLANTLIASVSAASLKRIFKSKSMRVKSLIFQAKRAVSASHASAGLVVSVTLRYCETNCVHNKCASFSSEPGLRVMVNKSSLRPRNSAKAR